MSKNSSKGFQMKCPLAEGVIDSDLCIEVQECIDGNIPVTIELEDFLMIEDYEVVCHNCKYHI